MHRFYISPEEWQCPTLALRGSEAHHARDVLRMKAGEKIVLFNGRGREVTVEIAAFEDDEIRRGMALASPPESPGCVAGPRSARRRLLSIPRKSRAT